MTRRLPTLTRLVGQKGVASLSALGVARATDSFTSRLMALLTPTPAYAQLRIDIMEAL